MAELFGRVDGDQRRAAAARCTSSTSSAASWAATGSSAATCRSPPGVALAVRLQGTRRGHRLHVRRRRLQRRQLRRDDEPGGALEAAGRLPGREQPVRDGHRGRAPLGRQTDLSKKAEGYGVPGARIDGMDVLDGARGRRRGAAAGARGAPADAARGRHLPLPRPLRRPTPRSTASRRRSRSGGERDPIESFAPRCVEEGVTRASARSAGSTARPRRRSWTAVEFAEASPEPALDSLYDDLYVLGDQVRGWYAVDERSPSRTAASDERDAASARAHELAEAGAAYAGAGRRRTAPARRQRDGGARATASPRSPRRTEAARCRLMASCGCARRCATRWRRRCGATRRVFVMGEDVGVFQGAFKVTEGLLERVRRAARARHADLREHDRRRRGRLGDGGPAAGGRADDGQLLAAGAGPDRQPRRRDPLHVRRPGEGAAGDPHAAGRAATSSARPTRTASRRCTCTCPACWSPAHRPPADAKGLLKAAIRDDNPVIFIEHETSTGSAARCPRTAATASRFGEAAVRREGGDVTIVGISRMAHRRGAAAERSATSTGSRPR